MPHKKIDRNKVNVDKVNDKNVKSMEGKQFAEKRECIMIKNNYIKNQFNGYYYLERHNMLVAQITKGGEIVENIDGAPKTARFIYTESLLMRRQAIDSFRAAFFLKKDLIDKYKMTVEEIKSLEEDYSRGLILRDEYEEGMEQTTKAQFVPA